MDQRYNNSGAGGGQFAYGTYHPQPNGVIFPGSQYGYPGPHVGRHMMQQMQFLPHGGAYRPHTPYGVAAQYPNMPTYGQQQFAPAGYPGAGLTAQFPVAGQPYRAVGHMQFTSGQQGQWHAGHNHALPIKPPSQVQQVQQPGIKATVDAAAAAAAPPPPPRPPPRPPAGQPPAPNTQAGSAAPPVTALQHTSAAATGHTQTQMNGQMDPVPAPPPKGAAAAPTPAAATNTAATPARAAAPQPPADLRLKTAAGVEAAAPAAAAAVSGLTPPSPKVCMHTQQQQQQQLQGQHLKEHADTDVTPSMSAGTKQDQALPTPSAAAAALAAAAPTLSPSGSSPASKKGTGALARTPAASSCQQYAALGDSAAARTDDASCVDGRADAVPGGPSDQTKQADKPTGAIGTASTSSAATDAAAGTHSSSSTSALATLASAGAVHQAQVTVGCGGEYGVTVGVDHKATSSADAAAPRSSSSSSSNISAKAPGAAFLAQAAAANRTHLQQSYVGNGKAAAFAIAASLSAAGPVKARGCNGGSGNGVAAATAHGTQQLLLQQQQQQNQQQGSLNKAPGSAAAHGASAVHLAKQASTQSLPATTTRHSGSSSSSSRAAAARAIPRTASGPAVADGKAGPAHQQRQQQHQKQQHQVKTQTSDLLRSINLLPPPCDTAVAKQMQASFQYVLFANHSKYVLSLLQPSAAAKLSCLIRLSPADLEAVLQQTQPEQLLDQIWEQHKPK